MSPARVSSRRPESKQHGSKSACHVNIRRPANGAKFVRHWAPASGPVTCDFSIRLYLSAEGQADFFASAYEQGAALKSMRIFSRVLHCYYDRLRSDVRPPALGIARFTRTVKF
jgi:hypothetical protein